MKEVRKSNWSRKSPSLVDYSAHGRCALFLGGFNGFCNDLFQFLQANDLVRLVSFRVKDNELYLSYLTETIVLLGPIVIMISSDMVSDAGLVTICSD